MPLAPGTRLGPYEIQSAIGAGGMGEVYRARDTKLGREVALKVLPDVFASDPERLARFQREAQVLALLNHPRIAAIYGLEEGSGEAGHSVRALVLELVEGETLADRIKRGPIRIDEALAIARQIAEALEAAHEQGIIHRDLKPANIKLRADGTVKVLDFGLSKLAASESSVVSGGPAALSNSPTINSPAMVTGVGMLLGTAAYMAPEQAKGQTVDRRADVWAFGAVLWEMLTGKALFAGEHVSEVLAGVLRQEVELAALPSETPLAVRRLLRHCLERNPKNRLHDIADARIVLDDLLAGRSEEHAGISAAPPGRSAVLRWLPWGVAAVCTGTALWLVLARPATTPGSAISAPPRRVEIVGISVAQSSNVAISPDGNEIVGYDMTPGKPILLRRSLNSFDTRAIPGSENAFNPFFSPDGRAVGFFSSGQVCAIAIDGGTRRCFAEASGFATGSWGPDGTIVYAHAGTPGREGPGLWRVSSAGGTAERLTEVNTAAGELGHIYPHILHDGRHVIFSVLGGRQNWLAVAPVSGGMPTMLLSNAARARYVRSGHLVYWDRVRGELRVVAFDPVTLAVGDSSAGLGSQVDSTSMVATGDTQPAFEVSDTGTLVYATGAFFDENFSVVLVDSSGRVTPLIDEPASWAQPSLSPDGRTLILRRAAQPDCSLWLFDLERRSLSRLSQNGDHHNPLWTSDGRSVVFSYLAAAGLRQIYEQSIDGGAHKPILRTTFPALAESISPNGRYVAVTYDARRERNDILMHDRTTGETTPLLATDFDEDYPAFSRDGRLLAYVSNDTGRPEVYVRPFPGAGAKHRVSSDGGTGPLWSRDGRTLYYAEGSRMMRVAITASPRFAAGTPERVFESAEFVWDRPRNYEVLSDDRTFVMIRRSRAGSAERRLRVVFDWFSELERLVPTK